MSSLTNTVMSTASMPVNGTSPWCIEMASSKPWLTTSLSPMFNGSDVMDNLSIPICDDTGDNLTEDKLMNYWEYIAATYINKYYLFVIVALGLPGNIAALATVIYMKPFVSSSLYMAALSIVDSLNLIVKILYLQLTLNNIELHDTGCQVSFFFGTFFMHLSNWILVAMTIERFVAIWFPLKVSDICTKSKAMIVMMIIAMVLAGLNFHFFFTMYETYVQPLAYNCQFREEYIFFKDKIWYWIDGAAYSIVPFVALTAFNVLIVIGINRSAQTQKTLIIKQTKEKMSQQHQVTVMLVTVSVVFVLLTMPNCIFFIFKDDWNYMKSKHEAAKYSLVSQVVFFLSDVNHAINFYLYFLSGKKFRRHFKAMVCGRKRVPLRAQSTMISRSVRNTTHSISSSANSLVMSPSSSVENGVLNSKTNCDYIKKEKTADTSLNGSTVSIGNITLSSSNDNGVTHVSNGSVY